MKIKNRIVGSGERSRSIQPNEQSELMAIEFVAEVRGLKLMADYSANLTLNVPEPFKPAVMGRFSKWQGKMVRIVAVVED